MTKSIIRDVVKLNKSIVRWSFIDETLPGKERPTDVDGMIEKKGHFLMLEHKNPGAPIPRGQDIMYRQFSKKEDCSVLVFYGKMEDNLPKEIVKIVKYKGGLRREIKNPSLETFKKIIKEWREIAGG